MLPRAESQYLYPHITGISFKVTLCQRNICIQNKCLSSYCVAESKASFGVACEQAVRGLWHRGKNRGRFNKKILASFTDMIFTVRHLSKYEQKNITPWPHLKSANQHLTPLFGPFCDVDAKKKNETQMLALLPFFPPPLLYHRESLLAGYLQESNRV